MNNQEGNIEKFDQYLEDKLNPDEKEILEKELKNDKRLQREFNDHKKFVDGIKLHGRKQLLEQVRAWENELDDQDMMEGKVRPMSSFKWYYAAAALIATIVSVAIIYSNIDNGYENLVADYYQPYEYISSTQRGESEAISNADDIYRTYDQGNYKVVLGSIDEMNVNEKTDLIFYIQANSHQALGDFSSAIPLYEKVIEMNTTYANGARWYLALCLLSEKQADQASLLLEELVNTASPYALKAENLLSDMD